jgi:D-alanine-D-alanine ligase
VIFGGRSGEHEVSLVSAQSVMSAINKDKYEVIPIGIDKGGRWLTSGEPMRELKAALATPPPALAASFEPTIQPTAETRDLIPGTAEHGIPSMDVLFPVLHGPFGEDGTVQGLLELANLPYVGSGVLGSALGMDKIVMKSVFRDAGLPVVPAIAVLRRDWESRPEEIVAQVNRELGYPCFIKPANLGSSVGISKAHNADELPAAINLASSFDRRILVEQAVDAREIECSVLGNDAPIASVLGEILPKREFYDYQAKYGDEDTELIIPAPLPTAKGREIQELAVRAFQALDCAGMARVDFFLSRQSGQVYVNEVNTIPGFTSISMYPKLWEASGLPYPELIDRLISLALERFEDKQRNRTSYTDQPTSGEGKP